MMKRRVHRGFSLIELLLAIFILGIGVISIATLFPAGIAQQLKTTDDVIGPIVARNALSIIRSRVEQEDFGGAEAFEKDYWSPYLCGNSNVTQDFNDWPTICGDWMWRRPALVQDDYGNSGEFYSQSVRGAINIFGTPNTEVLGGHGAPLTEYWTDTQFLPDPECIPVPGIPYNLERYPPIDGASPGSEPDGDTCDSEDDWNTPVMLITAGERQYPMWTGAPDDRPKGEYYWDCMFKRYSGRVQVAIFVYRVIDPAQDGSYTIDTQGLAAPNFPIRTNLASETSTGSWNAVLGSEVLSGSEQDDPTQQAGQWQFPGQWIVDQNGNIHRVQRGRRRMNNSNPVLLSASPSELMVSPPSSTSDR